MREKIINIISEVTKIEYGYLLDHCSAPREWDSMNHIELILQIEDEYDIRFSEIELTELDSVDAICNMVIRKANNEEKY